MLKFKYFLRTHKYEFIPALFALISSITAFRYSENQATAFQIFIFVSFVALAVIVYLRSRDRDFYYVALTNLKDKYDWLGRGEFQYERTQRCFSITNSDPGHIYSKCLAWSNYRFEFKFKIIKDCVGAIVRSVNLSNYAMLQIGLDGIRPHIRINGSWLAWEHADVGLTYEDVLSADEWYLCRIVCDKEALKIKLYNKDNDKIFDREWNLPQGSLVFTYQKEKDTSTAVGIPFMINLEYGSIGFRNWGDEKAHVKDVFIEKL